MIAPKKTRRLVCTLVRVAEEPQESFAGLAPRPSALLPWADPYIAGLVRRLQSEVRMERAAFAESWPDRRRSRQIAGDLEPPNPFVDGDWDWCDEPRWTVEGECEE